MKVQQIQPYTTFGANKTTRRLDYESYEQLEQILTKMDKETLYKQDEYSFESTRTKRLSLYDHKNREIAELIDSRQILVPIENRNQMFDNTYLTIGKVQLVIENKTGKIIDYYKPFLKTWNSVLKNIKNTLLDFNNGFYTKGLVEKHRIGIQGFTEKGFKIIKGIKAK
jgi:hypothetical protein